MVIGRADYHSKHEPIIYGWKNGGSHYFLDDRSQTTAWDIKRPSRSEEHPTMKPVELVQRAITNSTKREGLVLDTFGGSGSTLIAAEKAHRTCYMMELDPKYVDVIRKRYAKHIGAESWEEATPKVTTSVKVEV